LARITTYRIAPLRGVPVPRLRIAILSDLHANRPFMGPGVLRRLVAQTQGLEPDLVLLLGDYAGHVIGGRSLSPQDVTDALAPLDAPLGVFAVFGNHDWRNDPAPAPGRAIPTIWHRGFDDAGIPTLSNVRAQARGAGRRIPAGRARVSAGVQVQATAQGRGGGRSARGHGRDRPIGLHASDGA
jgi:3',5'-cyclic AMP phosphodiesterase CpdA